VSNVGVATVALLERYGVDTVFGIPGVHTLELYRGLGESSIRHITPRHEQGGAFMADGWSRVTGRPGVCLVITGPGVTNALTPVAQAHHDSKPLLVLSAAVDPATHGRGTIHDLPDQRALTSAVTAFSVTASSIEEVDEALCRAWDLFASARPRPVHIEIPVDVLRSPAGQLPDRRPAATPPAAAADALRAAAELLAAADRPAVLLGGGAVDAGAEALALSERLDAPIGLTINARGAVGSSHPLCVGSAMSFPPVSDLVLGADVLLAVGTEFSELDWWFVDGEPRLPETLVRIDIDETQLRSRPCTPLHGEASATLRSLVALLEERPPRRTDGAQRVARALADVQWPADVSAHLELVAALDRALPEDRIVAADSTQPAYAANHAMPAHRPRSWLMPIGYGSLGCALPMAIGAKVAAPDRPVAALAGDGGVLFTLTELAAARDLGLALPVVVWNNSGYGEIRDSMQRVGIPPLGTDASAHDLVAIAQGFGCHGTRTGDLDALVELVGDALAADRPTLIEVRP
jgi:acetolactate synthase I/II/III large subunit